MTRVKVKSYPSNYPYGKQKVDKIRPSTGIYGKHVGGQRPKTSVRVRKGR